MPFVGSSFLPFVGRSFCRLLADRFAVRFAVRLPFEKRDVVWLQQVRGMNVLCADIHIFVSH